MPQVRTTNLYGTSKAMIEQVLSDLFVSNHSRSIDLLRDFNSISAHKSGLISEDPKGKANALIPLHYLGGGGG